NSKSEPCWIWHDLIPLSFQPGTGTIPISRNMPVVTNVGIGFKAVPDAIARVVARAPRFRIFLGRSLPVSRFRRGIACGALAHLVRHQSPECQYFDLNKF